MGRQRGLDGGGSGPAETTLVGVLYRAFSPRPIRAGPLALGAAYLYLVQVVVLGGYVLSLVLARVAARTGPRSEQLAAALR